MSAFEIINKPIHEIREFLSLYHAELRQTALPDTYIIKFKQDTCVADPNINHLRGLIFNAKNKTIYSMTYPVPIEFKDQTPEKKQQIIDEFANNQFVVNEALDGTLLRLAFIGEEPQVPPQTPLPGEEPTVPPQTPLPHPDTPNESCSTIPHPDSEGGVGGTAGSSHGWILSTNGKLDARDAFWMNNTSFFDQFWSANPNIDFLKLNKNFVYLFLLCHPLNVIVVNHTDAKVFHITTFDRFTMNEIDDDIGIPKPTQVALNIQQVIEQTSKSVSQPVSSAGFIAAYSKNGIVHRVRFENDNYTHARNLRGDSNNIQFTLLQLIQGTPSELADFLKFYPIYHDHVLQLQQKIDLLTYQLLNEYSLRYKAHKFINITQDHHIFIKNFHTNHFLKTHTNTTLLTIHDALLLLPTSQLAKLL